MSVICQVQAGSERTFKVLSKGAPEILSKFIKDKPSDYDQLYLKHVKEGSRVLALAYKNVKGMSAAEVNTYSREEAECDLIFCGFLVAECPLK